MNQPPAAHADRHRPSMGPPRYDRPVGPALRAWRDIAGSKVRPAASLRAALALVAVARGIRRRGRG